MKVEVEELSFNRLDHLLPDFSLFSTVFSIRMLTDWLILWPEPSINMRPTSEDLIWGPEYLRAYYTEMSSIDRETGNMDDGSIAIQAAVDGFWQVVLLFGVASCTRVWEVGGVLSPPVPACTLTDILQHTNNKAKREKWKKLTNSRRYMKFSTFILS